jgi:uncharacterized protein (TIGR00730 family)
MSKRICVYCASSEKVPSKYFDDTKKIAAELVAGNHHVVYGGGAVGLMGTLADTVIDSKGKITGIMPSFMKEVEWNHPRVTDMVYTDTMAQRKEMLLEGADIALSLPGGCGTYEEFMEAITLKRLGLIGTDIVFYNQDGFYEPIKQLFEQAVNENFMTADHMNGIKFFDTVDTLMYYINHESKLIQNDINEAVVR